jgi:hypothetical protein
MIQGLGLYTIDRMGYRFRVYLLGRFGHMGGGEGEVGAGAICSTFRIGIPRLVLIFGYKVQSLGLGIRGLYFSVQGLGF